MRDANAANATGAHALITVVAHPADAVNEKRLSQQV